MLIGPWAHVPGGSIVGGADFGPAAAGTIVDRARSASCAATWTRSMPAMSATPRCGTSSFSRMSGAAPNPGRRPGRRRSRGTCAATAAPTRRAGMVGSIWSRPARSRPTFIRTTRDPVPSVGGHSCCTELTAPMGAYDQARVEQRRDVLVYTSAPLTQDVRLCGPSRLQLWVQSDAPDADYTGKLCVVDGRASVNVAEGIHRATGDLAAATPGEPLALEIELRNVAALVRAGQRLRLEVTSGSFPMYDVNPQSGVPAAHATVRDYLPATHAVFHTTAMPSRLIVTVVEASPADARNAAVCLKGQATGGSFLVTSGRASTCG